MPLICFRKKTNLRRSPSMKNFDSFSSKRMTVARVYFWCMKSTLCPTAQQFLSQVSHGFPSSFHVHPCSLSSPGISSLLYLLICWLQISFFSVLQDLWYCPTICLSVPFCWNKGWHSEMAISEVKLVVPRDLFPSFFWLLVPFWYSLSAFPDTANRSVAWYHMKISIYFTK